MLGRINLLNTSAFLRSPDEGGAPPPAEGTSEAAQGALKASDTPVTLVGEKKEEPKAEAKADVKAEEPKKEEPKKEEPKKEEPAKAFDPAALKLPEGMKADDAMLSELSTVLSNDKLDPQQRAQSLVDLHVKALQSVNTKITDYWTETNTKWTKEVAADKDIGTGDEKNPLKPEVQTALSKAIDAYGGKELRDALNQTGAGNNPAIIRAFYKMAGKLVEGGHVAGNPAGSGKRELGAAAMFPDLPSQGT